MVKPNRLLDTLSLIFSLLMVGGLAFWTLRSDLFWRETASTWELIRSSGITAYLLFTLSMVWGLALSTRVVKDWSPGSLSMTLHTGISWTGVGLALVHAVLLLFDEYFTYQVWDILVPFIGPYRPLAVGLGTLTFWLMVAVSLSFTFKKKLGRQRWKLLHYTSYAGFFMVTAHAFFAGSDTDKMGFRLVLMLSVALVMLLSGYRLAAKKKK
jgi:predicted ferric reductase